MNELALDVSTATPRPAVRLNDRVLTPTQTYRVVGLPHGEWSIEIGTVIGKYVVPASDLHEFTLKRTMECLDGVRVMVPAFGLVDAPKAGFAVASLNDVMCLKVYNSHGGMATVVAQSSTPSNPWVVTHGGSSVELLTPAKMIAQGWRTKRGKSLIDAYLGVRRPKDLKVGTVLQHNSQVWVVQKLDQHNVLLFSITERTAARIQHQHLLGARVLGSKRTVADLRNGFFVSKQPTIDVSQVQALPSPAPAPLTERFAQAMRATHLVAPPSAQQKLEELLDTGTYLLGHLDLLVEPNRSEAQKLMVEHLIESLNLFEEASEHSMSAQATEAAGDRLIEQLVVIKDAADRYQRLIESEVARKQAEHSAFLNDKLRPSALD